MLNYVIFIIFLLLFLSYLFDNNMEPFINKKYINKLKSKSKGKFRNLKRKIGFTNIL